MNIEEIQDILERGKTSLRDKYHIKKIGIFGSVVRGEENEKSDVDILVEFSKPISMFRFIELEESLSALLKRKVDLVTRNALKSAIKDSILSEVRYV